MKRHHRKKAVKFQKRIPQKKKAAFKGIDNTKDIDLILSNTKLVQDLLGFAPEELTRLFDTAVAYLRQHRFEEAIRAFQLLTQVNPYIADFWLGIGLAQQGNGDYQKALTSYLVAETMDPARIDIYSHAIDLCLEMKDFAQAQAILEHGLTYAKRHLRQEEGKVLLRELKTIQNRIFLERPQIPASPAM